MMGRDTLWEWWTAPTESVYSLFKRLGTGYYYPRMSHRGLTVSANMEANWKPMTTSHPGETYQTVTTQGSDWCLDEHLFIFVAKEATSELSVEEGKWDFWMSLSWVKLCWCPYVTEWGEKKVPIPLHCNAAFRNLGKWGKHVEDLRFSMKKVQVQGQCPHILSFTPSVKISAKQVVEIEFTTGTQKAPLWSAGARSVSRSLEGCKWLR